MTLSIITPSYNQGKFIEDTIKSVLDQAGDFSIQYIIADGGSTDETVSIIKKYDELLKNNQYPIKCKGITLTWWSRKDNGQAAAINEGFRLATGDILAWVNSDDFYKPGAFALATSLFSKNPEAVFFHGNAEMIDLTRNKIEIKKRSDGDYRDLIDDNFIHQPSTFFKREVLQTVGFLDESFINVLDYDYWIRLFKKYPKNTILFTPEVICSYRIWENAKTYALKEQERKERVTIDRKYGMKIISPNIIYNPYTAPLFYFMRDHLPFIFHPLKKLVSMLNNRKRY